jgi:hypothetical protein
MLMRLLDWLLARWLRRYEGDLPVAPANVVPFKVAPERIIPAPSDAIERINTPLADALSKPIVLPDTPDKTVTIKAEWDQATKDVGVAAEVDLDIGKPGGWTTGGKGGWWKDKGAAAMGWLKWEGK